ncbi:MAG TPA: SRPBCC family protein [Trinickia sp.]|nr:SRPBCC family protein [Trinickia sp.]
MKAKAKARLITTAFVALGAIGLFFVPLPRRLAPVTRIVTAASIARPDAVVFDYVTTPGNWPLWHPSSLAVSGATDHSLGVGEQVTEEFRVAGRRGRVVWTVAERNRPLSWSIDGAIDGRRAGTVTYVMRSGFQGTQFTREFAYFAPTLSFVVLNKLYLRQRIQAESDDAVARLKRVLEAGANESARSGAAP